MHRDAIAGSLSSTHTHEHLPAIQRHFLGGTSTFDVTGTISTTVERHTRLLPHADMRGTGIKPKHSTYKKAAAKSSAAILSLRSEILPSTTWACTQMKGVSDLVISVHLIEARNLRSKCVLPCSALWPFTNPGYFLSLCYRPHRLKIAHLPNSASCEVWRNRGVSHHFEPKPPIFSRRRRPRDNVAVTSVFSILYIVLYISLFIATV